MSRNGGLSAIDGLDRAIDLHQETLAGHFRALVSDLGALDHEILREINPAGRITAKGARLIVVAPLKRDTIDGDISIHGGWYVDLTRLRSRHKALDSERTTECDPLFSEAVRVNSRHCNPGE